MGAYQRSVSPFEFPLAISSYRTKMLRLNTVGAPQKLVSSAHFRPSFAKQPSFARPSPQRVNVGHDRHVLRTFAAISQPVSAPQSTSSEMVQKVRSTIWKNLRGACASHVKISRNMQLFLVAQVVNVHILTARNEANLSSPGCASQSETLGPT